MNVQVDLIEGLRSTPWARVDDGWERRVGRFALVVNECEGGSIVDWTLRVWGDDQLELDGLSDELGIGAEDVKGEDGLPDPALARRLALEGMPAAVDMALRLICGLAGPVNTPNHSHFLPRLRQPDAVT